MPNSHVPWWLPPAAGDVYGRAYIFTDVRGILASGPATGPILARRIEVLVFPNYNATSYSRVFPSVTGIPGQEYRSVVFGRHGASEQYRDDVRVANFLTVFPGTATAGDSYTVYYTNTFRPAHHSGGGTATFSAASAQPPAATGVHEYVVTSTDGTVSSTSVTKFYLRNVGGSIPTFNRTFIFSIAPRTPAQGATNLPAAINTLVAPVSADAQNWYRDNGTKLTTAYAYDYTNHPLTYTAGYAADDGPNKFDGAVLIRVRQNRFAYQSSPEDNFSTATNTDADIGFSDGQRIKLTKV